VVGEILNQYKNDVEVARLIPSSGGVFEVRVDGVTVFSKKAEHERFPDPGEALQRITNR
jgi:selenoprotein W-related protein